MSGYIERSCSKCDRTGGIVYCDECGERFCFEHLGEHRRTIENGYDRLIEEENDLERILKEENLDENLRNYFDEIDRWKKNSIEQIKQIAKNSKNQLRSLRKESNEKLMNLSKTIGENLRLIKQTENFSEIKLKKLFDDLKELKEKLLNQFEFIKSSPNEHFIHIRIRNENENEKNSSSSIVEQRKSNEENFHSNQIGSIRIKEIDRYGHFIIIEHDGSTSNRDEDLVGWTLKRMNDSFQELIYRFPNDFILKYRSEMKILSRNASNVLYSSEKSSCLIAETIPSWGITFRSSEFVLFDANGNERDHFHQKIFN